MKDWATMLSAFIGRDASKEIAALANTRAALGNALSLDQQLFVSSNWAELSSWLSSNSGKDAARFMVDEWADWVITQQRSLETPKSIPS